MSSVRPYDIVLIGATGFTGKLTAQYLAEHGPKTLKWAIAGRTTAKVEALAASLSGNTPAVLTANAVSRKDADALAGKTKVLITTVGPYAQYGDALVAACVAAKTHYVDLTGEPLWIKRSIKKHHLAAVRGNTAIVHSCGFDCLPADLSVLYAAQHLAKKHSLHAAHAELLYLKIRSSPSGGTLASMFNMIENEKISDLKAMASNVGYLTVEGSAPVGAAADVGGLPVQDEVTGRWKYASVMGSVNTRHVHRTRSLFQSDSKADNPFGDTFSYEEYDSNRSWFRGAVFVVVFRLIMLAMYIPPLRFIFKKLAPAPGQGASMESMRKGVFEGHARVLSAPKEAAGPKRRVTARVHIPGDPGYLKTAEMLANSALTLVEHGVRAGRGGVVTAGYAMGPELIERFKKHTDIEFEIVEDAEIK